MLAAWLHHKLKTRDDRTVETYEDLVTGTVFGLLEYLPWNHGLGPFLARLDLPDTSRGAVHFWPRHDGTEPDVVLVGEDWAVLVEAKVGADFGIEQLGREWALLLEHYPADRVRLAAVGPDGWNHERLRSLLESDLLARGAGCRRPRPHEVCSVRWHELLPDPSELRPSEQRLLDDLRAFLGRTGLLRPPFSGWHGLPPGPELPEPSWYGKARRGLWAAVPDLPPLPSADWYGLVDKEHL